MDGLDKILQECEAESSNQKLWQYMDLHQNELVNIAMSNDDYMLYLNQKGLTLEDLKKFTNHMAHLSEYVILADFYIIFSIISFFTLWICNYRRGFFIAGFFIYLISSISFFSNGMSDYLLSAVFSTLTAPLKMEFTYEDAFIFRQYFLNTLKEALLTFVLIDTAREIYKDNRNSYFQKTIRYTFQSLEIQIAHLEKNADLKNEFIGRLIIPSQQLEKKCRKTDNRLSQLLYSLRTNTEKHPCSKYIDDMKEAVDLMIKNDYSSV